MTRLFDKLNLRPGERRLVVLAGIVVFVFLNFWLVLPHFGDLARVQQQITETRGTLTTFQEGISKVPEYLQQKTNLAAQGAEVATAARALELQREVSSQALMCGVPVQRYDTPRTSTTRTNAYFDEQSLVISVTSGEPELLCFLHNLAARSSLIRVRSMNLQPDLQRHRLQGSITLVASYQRKPLVLPSAPATPAPAAKTASVPKRLPTAPPVAGPPRTPAPQPTPSAPRPVPKQPTLGKP